MLRVLCCSLLLLLVGCREELLHDLSESEANRFLARLQSAGISAQKEQKPDARWALTVGRQDTERSLQVLSELRAFNSGRSQPIEPPSLMSSREERKFQFERKLSVELEATLLTLHGVVEARVHLNLPAQDPLQSRDKKADAMGSASVLLVADRPNELDAERIAALIAGASGVPPTKVAVIVEASGGRELAVSNVAAPSDASFTAGVSYREEWLSWVMAILGLGSILAVSVWHLRRQGMMKELLSLAPSREPL